MVPIISFNRKVSNKCIDWTNWIRKSEYAPATRKFPILALRDVFVKIFAINQDNLGAFTQTPCKKTNKVGNSKVELLIMIKTSHVFYN